MKKAFEKFDLFKIAGLSILVTVLLTWIIKQSSFSGTELVVGEITRIGLNDFCTYALLSVYYFSIIVTFLLILGTFYQVLSKTSGYQALIEKLTKILKGKEIAFVLVTSFLFAVVAGVSTEVYQIVIFAPFVITLALRLKLDKITAFCITFGGILIGLLGATFSPLILSYLNSYLGVTYESELITKIIIFGATYILFNLFTIIRVVKTKAVLSRKDSKEEIEDKFEVTESSKKGTKVWPLIVILAVVMVYQIAGYISWESVFEVKFFANFNAMISGTLLGNLLFKLVLAIVVFGLVELVRYLITLITKKKFKWQLGVWIVSAIGVVVLLDICSVAGWFDFYSLGFIKNLVTSFTDLTIGENVIGQTPILSYFLGTNNALGKWDLYTIQLVLLLATIVIAWVYKVKFDEFLGACVEGSKKMLKPILIILMVYTVCIFTVMFPVMPTIVDAIMGLASKFNIFLASLSALIASVFNVEMRYITASILPYITATYTATEPSLIAIIYQAMYGFVQFFAPTSLVLMLGLSYLDIKYKDWIKYIWLFLVGLLVILIGIIAFIAYV